MRRNRVIIGTAVLLLAVAAFSPHSRVVASAYADDGFTPPKPIPSCMVQPVYPEQEKINGIEGMVLLGVEVKSNGTVGSIKAEREVKDHPAFTSSAIAAIGKWCFEPARRDGRAVACSVAIPVRFALEEKKK